MRIKVSRSQLVLILSSGLFLAFVLYVYKAFGIDQGISFSGHPLSERVTLFGLNVSFVFAFNELLLKPQLLLNTRIKAGLWIFWEIFSAATATHLLFNYFWNWTEGFWSSYFLLFAEMVSVLIIPFGLYFLLNSKEGKREMLVFTSENRKEKHAIQSTMLLYVKAEDNYVKVVYRNNEEEKSFLLRRKLSDIEKQFPSLVRVHRSYLVNMNNVVKVEQKSKSTAVHFETGSSVPFSTKYQSSISRFLTRPV